MVNVLLVEDDLDLAMTVVQFLELEEVHCDHASTGSMGLQLMRDHEYDVLLLDLNLPRLDGVTLCEALRNEGCDVPILMLTARDTLEDKIQGFRAGADDFLVKPFDLEELILRVQALTRRRSGQARIISYADLRMDLNARTVSRGERVIKVSPIGWRLLEILIREAPDAVSRSRLESGVWGDDIPDSNSLKVHMHHLRKAVDGDREERLFHTIAGFGFMLRAPECS